MTPLEAYGWNADLYEHPTTTEEDTPITTHTDTTLPARVLTQERNIYRVITAYGELVAELAGRLRYTASEPEDVPVVGDWVRVTPRLEEERATINRVYPRRSALTRKQAGRTTQAQILAANVDSVFLVAALNAELNPRRIERYLTSIRECGAAPVLILNKRDLHPAPDDMVAELIRVAPGVPIHTTSALQSEGIEPLRPYFEGQHTVVVVGSSGVGKSTLVNALVGARVQEVHAIREQDDKGRHTTTRRDLLLLPGGGVLIDTPGLRELGLWDGSEGVDSAFPEIRDLSRACRFRDCGHDSEPGCAVRGALVTGHLEFDRLESYSKLLREQAFVRRKTDQRARSQERRRHKQRTKSYRQRTRLRNRGRI